MKSENEPTVLESELCKSIRDGTYEPPSDLKNEALEESLSGYLIESPSEDLKKWDRLKLEKRHLTAIFINHIWNSFSDKREQFIEKLREEVKSYTHKLSAEDPIVFRISVSVANMFNDATKKFLGKLKNGDQADPNMKVIMKQCDRLETILKLGARCFPGNPMYSSISSDILSGIGTARKVTYAMVDLIPELFTQNNITLNKESLLNCLKHENTFLNIFILASQSLGGIVDSLRQTQLDKEENDLFYQFDPQYFKLSQDNNGEYYVSLDRTKLDLNTGNGKCPALVRDDDNSYVVREFYNWVCETADVYLYPVLLNRQNKS